tara:strand:+ start:241 stop:525 length:285 start_codon:yes stop_codon:yes gene_type:complete
MDEQCTHSWTKITNANKIIFLCEMCGLFRNDEPKEYIEELHEDKSEIEDKEFNTCKHIWRSLGDGRCHKKRGKAGGQKYICYKCELCGKFQRRT